MTLADILAHLDAQPDDGTILAEPPWTLASRATVKVMETDSMDEMTVDGQTYLIEVDIVREVRDDLVAQGWAEGERLWQRLVDYARNDA